VFLILLSNPSSSFLSLCLWALAVSWLVFLVKLDGARFNFKVHYSALYFYPEALAEGGGCAAQAAFQSAQKKALILAYTST